VGIVLSGIDNESRFAPHNTAFVDLGVSSRHAGSKGGAEPKGIGSVFQTLKDLHMIRAHSQTNILPRGLNIQAAAYWGVSPGTFKKLVRLGLAPPPLKRPGLDRNVFDLFELNRAMDAARQTQAA
jgi:hypothetical protein